MPDEQLLNSPLPPVNYGDPQGPSPIEEDPSEKLRQFLAQHSQDTAHNEVLKLLHMTPEERANRGKLGNFGQGASNVLQALIGRNFVTEGQQNYDAQTKRLSEDNQTLRNSDLAKQATENLDIKQQLADVQKQKAEETRLKDKNTYELGQKKNEIQDKLVTGRMTQYEAQALLAQAKASTVLDNGGMTGEFALVNRIANGDNPEEVARLAKAFGLTEAAKGNAKFIRTGTNTSMTSGIDAAGNPTTSRSAQGQFSQPGAGIFQQMLGQLTGGPQTPSKFGVPINGQSPSPAQSNPQSAPQAPVNPIQQMQNSLPPVAPNDELVSDKFQPEKFIDDKAALALATGNRKTLLGEQTRQQKLAAAESTKFEAKRVAVGTNAEQVASLAQAMANDKASFQGPVANLLKPIRNSFTGISAEEANQRIQDFRSMYDNLGSNMKGAYKALEINQAGEMQGITKMAPETALALHVGNLLSQQEQMLEMGRSLQGKNGKPLISHEEVTKLATDEISRYVNQVMKLNEAAKTPIKKLLGGEQQAPPIRSMVDLINDYLTKKKIGLAASPGGQAESDADFLKRIGSGR